MPTIPRLDRVLELRFYGQAGLQSSGVIYARREARTIEHSPRTGAGARPTLLERVRYLVHANPEIEAALTGATFPAPVRIYDGGVNLEYVIGTVEETRHRGRVVLSCTALPASQR